MGEMNRQTQISARHSAMAGQFFPGEAASLARAVEACLEGALPAASPPRAVISPHAGYPFSGRLAGAALGATQAAAPQRIVVLSPSHRHGFNGVALPSQDRYALPGFEAEIDTSARAALVNSGLAHVEDAAHDREHGIETQLPFLHRLHPNARIVPLVIGRARPGQVAAIVDALAGLFDLPPLFVLSSDLSHFLTLEQARVHDAETARLIETGKPDALTGAHACGAAAIHGFMSSAYGQGMRVQRLGQANSADVTGDAARTVGYGAWAFFANTDKAFLQGDRAGLLETARGALRARLEEGAAPALSADGLPTAWQTHGASFVTLTKNGRLRGCLGTLEAHRPLVADVADNAVKSALQDPRFPPVSARELPDLSIKLALLSSAAPLRCADEAELLAQLIPGRDGLILSDKGRRGVFLPMVWDSLPEPPAFLAALRQKAGLPAGHWSDTLQVERFCAEGFSERD